MRTFLRKFEEALAGGDAAVAKDAFVKAQSELMRAVGKGVVHKNTGSRKVSRLAARLKKLSAPPKSFAGRSGHQGEDGAVTTI